MSTHGAFSWHECRTHDPEANGTFLTALFGWREEPVAMPEGEPYRMIEHRDGPTPFGGICALDGDDHSRPHWNCSVAVGDLDRTTLLAAEAGGSVVTPPTPIPGVGRYSLVADPQGAAITLFEADDPMPELPASPRPGGFCWYRLLTPDPQADVGFYTELFGWSTTTFPDLQGPVFTRGDRPIAGTDPLPEGQVPRWIAFVAVADLDAATQAAGKLGAELVVPPTPLPGIGHFSVIEDPQGAELGLLHRDDALL